MTTRSKSDGKHVMLPYNTCLSKWVHLSDLRHVEDRNLFEIIANEIFTGSEEQKWEVLRPLIEKKNDRALTFFARMYAKSILCVFHVSRKQMLCMMENNYDVIQKIRFEDLRHHVHGTCDGLISADFLYRHFSLQCPEEENVQYFMIVFTSVKKHVSHLVVNALFRYFCQSDDRISTRYIVEVSSCGDMSFVPVARMPTLTHDVHTIKLLKMIGPFMDMYCLPPKLYPNIVISKKCKMPWFKETWNIAVQVGEITLLWYCGQREKDLCYEHDVFSWRDPKFEAKLTGITNTKKLEILERIIQANRSEKDWDVIIDPKLSLDHPEVYDKTKTHIYIDFEYIGDHVYLIGIWNGHTREYTALWGIINDGTIWDRMNHYLEDVGPCVVWYWWAEKNKCTRQKAPVDTTHWKDLCQVAKYMGMKGVFDFSLKSFVHAMHSCGRLPFSYNDLECSDGEASIALAQRFLEQQDERDRDILELYNRYDCEAMWYVHQVMINEIACT